MLNENAKKWVESLRSGEFKQGAGRLAYKDGRYCCLGVACELAIRAGIKISKGDPPFTNNPDYFAYDDYPNTLPPAVLDWLGLNQPNGAFGDGPHLVLLNDSGTPFHAIANIIESEPSGLFRA